MTMPDRVATFEQRFRGHAMVAAAVWLVFLAPAALEGWRERGRVGGWVGLLALAVFVGVYLWSFRWYSLSRRARQLWQHPDPHAAGIFVVLLLAAAVSVAALGESALNTAVYLAVVAAVVFPGRPAAVIVAALLVATETLARTVPAWQDAEGIGLYVALAAFAAWGVWQARRRSTELALALERNAALEIAEERSRLARDLHDILGHSLTVIAVKAELAGRLLDLDVPRAQAEVADIERLSRDALADVRATVDGYRELRLSVELTRARVALEAAGIEAVLPGSTDEVPSKLRELFAWTIREGVTNVVRHSAARTCTITLTPLQVSIVDDGPGMAATDEPGNGLRGLRERAAAAGATLVVDAPATGGFCLCVRAPASTASVSTMAQGEHPVASRAGTR